MPDAKILASIAIGAVVGLGLLALLLVRGPLAPRSATVPAPSVPHAAAEAEGITAAECWFDIPGTHRARCGVLTVPEQRGAARPRFLHLRFVVIGRADASEDDPIVYVSGGPGEPAGIDAASIGRWWQWTEREEWRKSRDLVLFDPRGVGLSEPRMDCPELGAAAYRVLGEPLTLADDEAIWAAAATACRARLAQAGVDLASYNTAAMAADLKSLLAGLGYRSAIILASSYGTRVALRFAADPAAPARALILDSVDPPDVPEYLEGAANAAGVFARLFQECAEEKTCRAAFPRLAASFERLVRRAATTPLEVDLPDPRGGTLTVRLDDAKLIETLFYAFYDWRRIEELPAVIAALAGGDTAAIRPLAAVALQNYIAAGVSLGHFLSVECHDEFPFNPRESVERAAEAAPLFRNFALSTLPLAACPAWPAGAGAAEERALPASEVPILMLSGELDPVTPPQWAARAAARLPHAFAITFRGTGHGVLAAQACAGRIVARFLADPTREPVDDCLLTLGPPHFRKLVGTQP